MKKVLIITYYFPPRPEIASIRLYGLAKYLPEFGWEPIILTPKLPVLPNPDFNIIQTKYFDIFEYWKNKLGFNPNETFKQDIEIKPSRIKNRIIRHFFFLCRDILAYPDNMKGWYNFALDAGNEILHKENVSAIISSSKPPTTHLIANRLKYVWNINWIADFRDPWTQDFDYRDKHSFFRQLFERYLEIKTLHIADALVTVSDPIAQKLGVLHEKKPIYTIPNGFDPDELHQNPVENTTNIFTITYTGSLYNCQRNPSHLFKAIQELIDTGIMDPDFIQIRFYGLPEECLDKLIEKYGLQKVAKQYGIVPRYIILEKQRESHLLLLLNWENYDGEGTYTGKIFEYLTAQRPILALGKSGGVIEDLLKRTGAGIYISKIDDIKGYILRCYEEYKLKGNVTYNGQLSEIKKYSHIEMAKSFSEILNKYSKG